MVSGETANTNFIVFGLTDQDSNPRSTEHTTPPMRLVGLNTAIEILFRTIARKPRSIEKRQFIRCMV